MNDRIIHHPSTSHHRPSGAPVGAVMVVGGGIAGMQAAMDLGDQGFKVYLVESKSAIGGHMAQLDKTFPTNDCAMCNISPKLVDTGRHINIEIITDADVLGVDGEAGNFTVNLRRRPRYIDIDKCVGCGDCVDVCPVILPDPYEEGLKERKAAYRLYTQAVPAAFAIEKLGIAPCRDACPTGQRVQGYIALIREGRYHDALRVIKEDNPFPGICGRICNHRCEEACNRSLLDEPLNIRALKRFVTDKVYAEERVPLESCEIKYDQRVAIIGAGPCGLTTAQDLCKLGYWVTIFESLPVAGGMLRVGVPEYRLPASIVDREVQDIVDLGVELRLNTFVENLDDVFDEGFDALLIAVGAHEGIRLPIPGADLDGVLVNTVFLRDVRLDNPPQLGKRVAVVGAGDVAMDVARTAVRLGADVSLYYRRTRSEATAGEEEIRHAEEEGVDFNFQVTPVEIVGDENKRMAGITCVRTEQGLPDATGRRQPVSIPGSEHFVPCDNIIFSVGQRAGLAFIPESAGVGITKQATIAVNPNTMAATRPGVFAAGDATTGTAFVIEAVEAGHRAAASIHRYLRGEELESPPKPRLPVVQMSQAEVEEQVIQGKARIQPRVPMDELPVEQRLSTFEEVVAGYTDEQAQAEAARCLACGICAECLSCQYECGRDAIDHNMVASEEQFDVGAIILAPGYQTYNAELSAEYGFGRYPNVVTALQFERLLSASGPTSGHVERPSDHKPAQKIAFLQCVGSRDQSHDYCSAVCCMYATKEAIMAVEHEPDTEVHIFMMDMRAFSKGYEAYYRRAQERYGINYTRCRISEVKQDPGTGNLVVRYASDQGSGTRDQGLVPSPQSLVPNPQSLIEAEFDLVVLSVGMEISDSVKRLGGRLGVELDEYGFCHIIRFNPIETSRPGIYAVGPFREPKDIPESVVEASGAAAASAGLLAEARGSRTSEREYPPERDISGEPARIGVFVCHCGSNIGGFLDVPDVAEYANTLPSVIHSEDTLYACSQDSIKLITERVEEHKLNRVVVASCTPLTHAPLFQDSIRAAGLNPYLFAMANIRNQCSWVHSDDWDTATTKAKELVRMAIARAALLEPQNMVDVPVHSTALVVGGGAAGMTAAISLAEQGFPVHLVEKEAELGGNLRYVFTSLETGDQGLETNDPQYVLRRLVEQIHAIPNITIHLESQVIATGGFVGNFASTIQHSDGSLKEISHGATILATGAQEYRGTEYGFGSDPRIVTQQEFEELLVGNQGTRDQETSKSGNRTDSRSTDSGLPDTVVMIQCIGPAEKYCSRICCTVAIKNALALKERNPNAQITILYKDIRTYGFKERLYTKAREHGVIFVRYNDTHEPEVRVGESANQRVGESASQRDSISNPQSPISNLQPPIPNPQSPISNLQPPITVTVYDPILGRDISLTPDLVVLSMPVVPGPDARDLSTLFKVPIDADGFFLEAHVKLRPVDFSTDGVFMAGMAHYPKFVDESMIQAQAAAARAARVLSQETLKAGGRVAVVDETLCIGCLTCIRVCPFSVPKIKANLSGVGNIMGAAYIEAAVCQGCGSCAAECPAKAIQLMHYTDAQMTAKVRALVNPTKVASELLSVFSDQ